MTDPHARHGSSAGPLPASTSHLPSPAIVCLMGPTASGKSGIALELAQTLPIEIISVDSALIYRGMDIGTAKPSAAERTRVPHHLIDILDPAQSYSAAQFRNDALRLIDEIRARGKLPLLVGGTMLYFKALREGLDDLPVADAVLRAQIEREAERSGWPALHAELARIDAATAARLAPNDAQRIQRALEVWRLTGKPISAFHQRKQRAAEGSNTSILSGAVAPLVTNRAAPHVAPHVTSRADAQAMPRFINIALEPSDRAVLHARIEARFDVMLEQGFLDEVRALRARGDLHPGLPSMRCVGYRQAWEYLDGRINGLQMRAQSIAATRQLAKRQLTWLRALDERIVIDCLADDCTARVRSAIGPYPETL